MEDHLKNRPRKKIFRDAKMIDVLREKAIEKVKSKFLPNKKIIKIILIGSSVNKYLPAEPVVLGKAPGRG